MSEEQPAGAPPALRVFALVAVCVGVAALAAAAFVFSYTGIHAVAQQAGVNTRLAKGYPLILDVLLVVILAAVLALRGAGWPSKLLAWISLLALLAAAAGADALHAAGDRLPARTAEITVAVLPWALVLIAFVLLLAMLRQARIRRQAQADERARQPRWQPQPAPPQSRQPLVPGFPAAVAPAPKPADTMQLVVPRQVTAQTAADSAASPAVAAPEGDLALDAEPAPDDPSSDEAAPDPADGGVPYPTDGDDAEIAMLGSMSPAPAGTDAHPAAPGPAADDPDPADADPADADAAHADTADADTAAAGTVDDVQTADLEMPVFHRMWSAPVPPSDDGD